MKKKNLLGGFFLSEWDVGPDEKKFSDVPFHLDWISSGFYTWMRVLTSGPTSVVKSCHLIEKSCHQIEKINPDVSQMWSRDKSFRTTLQTTKCSPDYPDVIPDAIPDIQMSLQMSWWNDIWIVKNSVQMKIGMSLKFQISVLTSRLRNSEVRSGDENTSGLIWSRWGWR